MQARFYTVDVVLLIDTDPQTFDRNLLSAKADEIHAYGLLDPIIATESAETLEFDNCYESNQSFKIQAAKLAYHLYGSDCEQVNCMVLPHAVTPIAPTAPSAPNAATSAKLAAIQAILDA